MHRLPSLEITDRSSCQFLLFEQLSDLWKQVAQQHDITPSSRTSPHIVLVDAHVRKAHRKRLEQVFSPENCRYYEIPPGEGSKSMEMYRQIIDFAFSGPLRRNTPLIAIGGGVTGDLSGFAAASLMRGLPLYHVPTTLLAMVDSAIGGKTGINHPFGKNTIGAFYHPRAVLFDTDFLTSLPQREWLCGLSEVLKYGYIREPELLEKAVRLADPDQRTPELLKSVIDSSVRIKTEIVSLDARESGIRAWLNFGHTFAHALETLDSYRNINHGEAVYAGMMAALYVSRRYLGASVSDRTLIDLKSIYHLDMETYTSRSEELVTLMGHDKKNRDHAIQLVLLDESGKPTVKRVEDRTLLKDAWNHVFNVLQGS